MRVQTFGSEAAVERFDERIVGWFAWSGEVLGQAGARYDWGREKARTLTLIVDCSGISASRKE